MKIRTILLIILFLFSSRTFIIAQEKFRVMFYNPENLYDTQNNPNTNDDDLTPEGNLHWSGQRYWDKLKNVSKVIYAVGENYPPALIGICEVENKSVLHHLTTQTSLRKDRYEYVITDSKDHRGSNIALLYQRDQMRLISKKSYRPFIDSVKTTRDILHVTGRIVNGDLLDIFVCHFPSRSEGIKKTTRYRITCAQLLKQKTDSLFLIRKKANIIIMGDFNDYPDNASLYEALKAKGIEDNISAKGLYNMFYHRLKEKDAGSYKYRGIWNFIDQFIVSGNLLSKVNRTSIKDKAAYIFKDDFLMEEDTKYGGKKPFRTYSGWKYLGGYSDHLPIYLDLIIK
ncbi:MAG: hypothetical protein LBR46_07460 [Prevotella sp.]|jgi:exonuclease III|nr:hypothetical protein [Prevotella sp.]